MSFRDLLRDLGDASYGPLFIIGGLIVLLPPLGAVPGLPAVVGIMLAVIAAQMVFGQRHVWLPGLLLDRSVSTEAVRTACDKGGAMLARIDGLIAPRWRLLTGALMRRLAAVLVAGLGVLMIPFELAPFLVAAPGAAIAVLGVAITARDGAAMALGLLGAAGCAAGALALL